MADVKISNMTAAGSLDGTELVPMVQGGVNVHGTSQAIGNLGFSDFLSGSLNTTAPNDTYNTTFLQATGGAVNWRQDLVLAPLGQGAISFTLPTGDGNGGNLRGYNAVDLQIFSPGKGSATQVASGQASAIGGGFLNTASAYCAAVGGGYANTASGSEGTVAGGQNNTVSSWAGFIGGGDGNTTCSQLVVIGGGQNNNASAQLGVIGGGYGNVVSAQYGIVLGGYSNTASGQYGVVGGGYTNLVDGNAAWCPGGQYAVTRGVSGMGAWSTGLFSASGDSQATSLVLRRATVDGTQTALTSDGGAADASNQLVLAANAVTLFHAELAAADVDNGDASAWTIDGAIKHTGGSPPAIAMVAGASVSVVAQDPGASAWAIAAAADTGHFALAIKVTGEADRTIRWVCRLESVELVFA